MRPTLQQELEANLKTPDGKKAFSTWLRHFDALADENARVRYSEYRERLKTFLGHIVGNKYKPWIPIGAISQQAKAISIKCQGRKVATAYFQRNNSNFMISFTKFAKDANPENESAIVETPKVPYRETLTRLRDLPQLPKFRAGVDNYPEWALEAWLAEQLAMRKKSEPTFEDKTPVDYSKMLLQVSSPFSASKTEGNGVKIAPKANGHSDILIRLKKGPSSWLGILELKAGDGKVNISKALCQAFAYTYCYFHAFRNLPQNSPERAKVLSVLGYVNPKWSKNGPPLGAIAVVPIKFGDDVIAEATERGLFDSALVREKQIGLFLWEYEPKRDGGYRFNEIRKI